MSNARIQWSAGMETEWQGYNPRLKEGEPAFVFKGNKKAKLVIGDLGGSDYEDSILVWDQDSAEAMVKTIEDAAESCSKNEKATAENAEQAGSAANAAKESEENAKKSETAAKESEEAIKETQGKLENLAKVATSGDYNDLANLPDLSNVGSGSITLKDWSVNEDGN